MRRIWTDWFYQSLNSTELLSVLKNMPKSKKIEQSELGFGSPEPIGSPHHDCLRNIGEMVRYKVTWEEIFRQRKFEFRVGEFLTKILWESVIGFVLLTLSLITLPLMYILWFTIYLVKKPLILVRVSLSRLSPN